MLKNFVSYVVLIGLSVGAVLFVLHLGADLPPGTAEPIVHSEVRPPDANQAPTAARSQGALQAILDRLSHPPALLLMQLIVIVAATRLVGGLVRQIGQPSVVGEMLAGIFLGPSLLGMIWPDSQTLLFPSSSMPALRLLSEIGVVLYMFLIGIDLDLAHLRQKAHAAILVSHASIVVPFFFGTVLCLFLYPVVAPANVPFTPLALFLGVAMSITAFPVLARIIDEHNMMGTFLGNTAIACAAVDDVTAWCLLAIVVAIAGASGFAGAAVTIGLTVGFVALMLLVVRPQAARFMQDEIRREAGGKGLVAGMLIFAFAAALFTEIIGIHALFGAFLAGAVMPVNVRLRTFLRERLEPFTTVLLLPLFFAFTGLRTQIGLLADLEGWLLCLAVIAVAVAGKLGGSMLAARWTGIDWKNALGIGILMNTRGLMELIVLNIGYDMGILSPRIFAMMVLMALVTTFMAGPWLTLLGIGRLETDDLAIRQLAHTSTPG
jgi:Kef-type K+ transport system membrane component KefB